jgi:hypothetical protein
LTVLGCFSRYHDWSQNFLFKWRRSMTLPIPRWTAALAVTIAFALPGSAGAQWLKYKTPGIPRTADGKPDLAAPAPRTVDGKPDFSGVWQTDNARAAETGNGYVPDLPGRGRRLQGRPKVAPSSH